MLSFADLKNHVFTYIFAFPALNEPGHEVFVLPYKPKRSDANAEQHATTTAAAAAAAAATTSPEDQPPSEAQFVSCHAEFTPAEQRSLAELFGMFAASGNGNANEKGPENDTSENDSKDAAAGTPNSQESKVSLADKGVFIIKVTNEQPGSPRTFMLYDLTSLPELAKTDPGTKSFFLAYIDPSSQSTFPGWPLRNALVLASLYGFTRLHVVAWRNALAAFDVPTTSSGSSEPEFLGSSLVGLVEIASPLSGALLQNPDALLSKLTFKATGWEKTDGKIQSRCVDLSSSMDSKKIMEGSVSLNLKLMRWRMLPGLDVSCLNKTKVLLIGSGTLGCNVARALVGWGIFNLTFVDSGRVSFSNPVRQTLFTFEDAENGRFKAEAAAARVMEIYPGAVTRGEVLTVPMPGHLVTTADQLEQALSQAKRLDDLIQSHDAVFLLTDSRESRWLPSFLCQVHDKICINAALGFDSFVVMRHGTRNPQHSTSEVYAASVREGKPELKDAAKWVKPNVGCYFCSDVTAPSNTLKDRTLDQQCTVTRPGLSFIASALAVELLVTILHNRHGYAAPGHVDAETTRKMKSNYFAKKAEAEARGEHVESSVDDLEEDDLSGGLGVIPHQIRGFFHDFSQNVLIGHPFDRCPACGPRVLAAYQEQGLAKLLTSVMNVSGYLEEVSGLAEMRRMAEENLDVWDDEALLDEFDEDAGDAERVGSGDGGKGDDGSDEF